jgi:hypothetical protein
LYRDHRGKTVVADVEGEATVAWANGPYQQERTDFSLTLFSDDPLFRAVIALPRFAEFEGDIFRGRDAAGAGVLRSNADARIYLNGSKTQTSSRSIPGMIFLDGFRSDVPLDYARLPFRTVLTDHLDVCDDLSRQNHSLRVQNESARLTLESAFEQGGRSEVACHVMHLNRMSFEMRAESNAAALLIRRTYDRFHGRQRARVLVNGEAVGWWYAPWEDRVDRWAQDIFLVPEPGARATIEIDPVAGSPLWSVSRYEALSVVAV